MNVYKSLFLRTFNRLPVLQLDFLHTSYVGKEQRPKNPTTCHISFNLGNKI